MTAARAAFDIAVGTAAKLIGALAAIKIIALFLGPAGVGMLGNFMSVVAILNILTCAGVSVGVTRFVARYSDSPRALRRVLRTTSGLVVVSYMLLVAIFLLFASSLSLLIFRSEGYESVLRLGSILFFPLGYSIFGMAMLNGFSETRRIAYVQAGAAVLGVMGLLFLTRHWELHGAALGLLWISACAGLILVPAVLTLGRVDLRDFRPSVDPAISRLMFRYALMMLITVISQNFAQFRIRDLILEESGWAEVGYWQAMSRTSDAYLQLFNAFLIAYLLPRLSRERDSIKALGVIRSTYRFLVPVLLAVLAFVFIARDMLIHILFSETFEPVRYLFFPQIIADFFKILAFIPGYLVVARGYTPFLVAADPLQVLLILSISPYFIEQWGAVGACSAAAVSYVIYFSLAAGLTLKYEAAVTHTTSP